VLESLVAVDIDLWHYCIPFIIFLGYEHVTEIIANLYCSVRYIEGTVSCLLEDSNGTVVGVQYREKGSEDLKVKFTAFHVQFVKWKALNTAF
jgi:hypothetical protein